MIDQATSDGSVLIVTQQISAPPNAVFDFLVDPAKMVRWMGDVVDLDPTGGGVMQIDLGDGDVASGTYLEVDRPHRVVFTWGWIDNADIPPGSTTVTITLTAQDGNTLVELRHDGLTPASQVEHHKGWTHFLGQFAELAPL